MFKTNFISVSSLCSWLLVFHEGLQKVLDPTANNRSSSTNLWPNVQSFNLERPWETHPCNVLLVFLYWIAILNPLQIRKGPWRRQTRLSFLWFLLIFKEVKTQEENKERTSMPYYDAYLRKSSRNGIRIWRQRPHI